MAQRALFLALQGINSSCPLKMSEPTVITLEIIAEAETSEKLDLA